MSRKNKWRTRGRFQFRRESVRYHDGSIWDGKDVLYIRIKKQACVFATWEPDVGVATGLWANDGLYFKPHNPIHAAKRLREGLLYR